MTTPLFGKTFQWCIVVHDVRESAARFWSVARIGPWRITTLSPPGLTDTRLRGAPVTYSMKVAFTTDTNGFAYELVQPLEGPSIYKEFLEKRGEGLHHIACEPAVSFEQTLADCRERGMDILMEGVWRGLHYVYFDTERLFSTVIEIGKREYGGPTEPDEHIPPQMES